jgi:hypothetical protein
MTSTVVYTICELHPVKQMTTLDNTQGATGSICKDSTGNLYIKHGGTWQAIATVSATPTETPLAITVQTQGGAVSRSLNESNGVVTLAATDTIVSNNGAVTLKNHSGTVSSGNAGLNSAGSVANVAAGALSAVTAGA